jgi:hypothetical protein
MLRPSAVTPTSGQLRADGTKVTRYSLPNMIAPQFSTTSGAVLAG